MASKTGGRHKLSACTGHGRHLTSLAVCKLCTRCSPSTIIAHGRNNAFKLSGSFWSPQRKPGFMVMFTAQVGTSFHSVIAVPLLPDSPFSTVFISCLFTFEDMPWKHWRVLVPQQAWSLSPQRTKLVPHVAWWRGRSAESAVPPRTTPSKEIRLNSSKQHQDPLEASPCTVAEHKDHRCLTKEGFWHQKNQEIYYWYYNYSNVCICTYTLSFFGVQTLRFIFAISF